MAFRVVPAHVSNEGWKVLPNRTGCGSVIGLLVARDVSPGTICKTDLWRIDWQNNDGQTLNLQVQRNGIWNVDSSVGGVLFPAHLIRQIGSINAGGAIGATATARNTELTRALHQALTESVGSWTLDGPTNNRVASFTFYRIEGVFSS
jgi:hypothetical protein